MKPTDSYLLQQWAVERDAGAFTIIVSRHGGMVFGTCRRILRDAAEAEDATQECFSTLARVDETAVRS